MSLPSNIQYHAGGAGMMGKPSLPIDSGAIVVSIVLACNFIVALINNMGSRLFNFKNLLCLFTVKIEEMSRAPVNLWARMYAT